MSTYDNYPCGSIPTDPVLRRHYISEFLRIYEGEHGTPPSDSALARHYEFTLMYFMRDHANMSVEKLASSPTLLEDSVTPPPAVPTPTSVASEPTPEPETTQRGTPPEDSTTPPPATPTRTPVTSESTLEPETAKREGSLLDWLRKHFGD